MTERKALPIRLDRSFWGGVTLVTIWLAVLFVGIFGGKVETHGAGGDSSSWPVVVVVAIAALLATVSIGRWAFRPPAADEERERERQAVKELSAEKDPRGGHASGGPSPDPHAPQPS